MLANQLNRKKPVVPLNLNLFNDMKYLPVLALLLFTACGEKVSSQASLKSNQVKFDNQINIPYWNDGKAEIATFELTQNRYNALHPGSLVMVFVTEDFLTGKQVKNESYKSNQSTKILKNIRIRKFTTGIYDYSLHTSVFTPLNRNKFNTLKVTNSMQEWCGTTFRQLNFKKDEYQLQVNSYFEGEGDNSFKLSEAILEDELMNLIRMSPSLLPTGEFEMISGLTYISLRHKTPKVEKVMAKLDVYSSQDFQGENLMEYSYNIESQNRTVAIVFQKSSPHQIVGITESYPSAFDGEMRTSIAKLKTTKRLKYWGLNYPKDAVIREELGL